MHAKHAREFFLVMIYHLRPQLPRILQRTCPIAKSNKTSPFQETSEYPQPPAPRFPEGWFSLERAKSLTRDSKNLSGPERCSERREVFRFPRNYLAASLVASTQDPTVGLHVVSPAE
ncbi:hypothetical protein T484DRAFT_2315924 [Baffinella frigidus]|nr:hypothetical protein T484DRAFT_2315924 [Cryptophyta sp. CCMP2293]